MEPFEQGSPSTGCMACHNVTGIQTDFLWSLKDHAFTPNVPNFLFTDKEIKTLQQLIRTTEKKQ
jgi:hypothetical protein